MSNEADDTETPTPPPPRRGARIITASPGAAPTNTDRALHAREHHDDFAKHAEPHDTIKGGFQSPRTRPKALHASEHHDGSSPERGDFADHAEPHDEVKGGFQSPRDAKKAVHASEHHADFHQRFYQHPDRPGGWVSKGVEPAKDDHPTR